MLSIREIQKYNPCYSDEEMQVLIDKVGIDTELTLKQILNEVGIKDAVWCLRVLDYKDVCLFNADVAESVLYIFEEKYTDDKRPRKAIEGIRKCHNGEITDSELKSLSDAAHAAAHAAYDTSAYSAYSAVAYAASYADAAYAYAATRRTQGKVTEELFIKHFVLEK